LSFGNSTCTADTPVDFYVTGSTRVILRKLQNWSFC